MQVLIFMGYGCIIIHSELSRAIVGQSCFARKHAKTRQSQNAHSEEKR